ncbi:MAG: 5'/3'-nucleotidase SurE [Treponema sp.]|nr:5'/3'-nucleotidase SurE [Treponema sp.]
MNLLLTNDDGFSAPGINALKKRLLLDGHNVMVFAPSANRSGASHCINLGSGVEVRKISESEYTCSGTPADCVMAALKSGVFSKIDLVLSGINQGPNIGLDIVYSGTCGAARQAVFMGVPAVALSVMVEEHDGEPFTPPEKYSYSAMADFAAKNLDNFSEMCVVARGMSMPEIPCCFVNVNGLSQEEPYKSARFSGISFREYVNDRITLLPKAEGIFERKFSGGKVISSSRKFSDYDALQEGSVAVTRVIAEQMDAGEMSSIIFNF